MTETGDMWRAVAVHSQKKRASNRESSAHVLQGRGISFTTHNRGAHLVIEHEGMTVDFWPGTGKWIVRGGKKGRGVFRLLTLLTGGLRG